MSFVAIQRVPQVLCSKGPQSWIHRYSFDRFQMILNFLYGRDLEHLSTCILPKILVIIGKSCGCTIVAIDGHWINNSVYKAEYKDKILQPWCLSHGLKVCHKFHIKSGWSDKRIQRIFQRRHSPLIACFFLFSFERFHFFNEETYTSSKILLNGPFLFGPYKEKLRKRRRSHFHLLQLFLLFYVGLSFS